MKKRSKIASSVVALVLAIVFVAAMIYYFGASYKQFDAVAKKEFEIPGLDTKFAPQGITYSEATDNFIVSGYMSNAAPSRVYFVKNGENKANKYITLTIGGAPYNGHCGGVTVYEDNVWVVGDKTVYRFSLSQALATDNAGKLEIIDSFKVTNGADFVLTYGNKLIVGEFYKAKKYDTSVSHHIKTKSGETNMAVSYVYTINTSNFGGVEQMAPEAGISMPGLVQGMAFTQNGQIVLSTSYGLPASNLLIYNNVLDAEPTNSSIIDEVEIPIYMLDDEQLLKSIKAPCMSEEVVLANGRVYVLFESNSKQYRLFTRTRTSHVYSLDI